VTDPAVRFLAGGLVRAAFCRQFLALRQPFFAGNLLVFRLG
jgi:hypothetical protein